MLLNADQLFSDVNTPASNKLNAAFLICLSGKDHPLFSEAKVALQKKYNDPAIKDLAVFYYERLTDIEAEISGAAKNNNKVREALADLAKYLNRSPSINDGIFQDKVWQLFFPEGVNVYNDHHSQAESLRKSRIVKIEKVNTDPLTNPGREILFTGNVLLGIPNKKTNIDSLNYSEDLKDVLKKAVREPQLYWYDHPIQIGVAPEANEILYGLTQLDKSLEVERERGNLDNKKVKCLLSVSVTHKGLQGIAKEYIHQELLQHSNLRNLEVFVFTEKDTDQLISDVFLRFAEKYVDIPNTRELLEVFGVDGEYGRHYSFLKAIAAVWNVFIDSRVKATFKIDLDQVFPQKELIEQSGASAFEHFKTPLWGASGKGSKGEEIELGMIAGALVNEKDIHKGLFTPDVTFPEDIPDKESSIFFSKMLMAFSTEGELMTRYQENSDIDGKSTCIERIHVTGGTNGILVKALRKHRPFTPSFIGRAEDQCYILSALDSRNIARLAYLHKDGLIMRHDKEAFAQEALKAAKFGNIVGDYIRTLYFSEYAKTINDNVDSIKKIVDPFTGCFISRIPVTVTMMRYVLKGAGFFEDGEFDKGHLFFIDNADRLDKTIQFMKGPTNELRSRVAVEREGWDLFYNILDQMESLIQKPDPTFTEIADTARSIVDRCRV